MTNAIATSVSAALTKVLARKDATFTDVVKVFKPGNELAGARPATPLPVEVSLDDEQVADLAALTEFFSENKMIAPAVRRPLKAHERVDYGRLVQRLSRVKKSLKQVDEAAKAVWHNHFDAVAEAEGKVSDATPFHPDNGWHCVEDLESGTMEGASTKIVRTVSGANSAELGIKGLAKLEQAGVITHAEYLKATAPIRVVDPAGVMALIAKRPEIASALADAATPKQPTVSITSRAV